MLSLSSQTFLQRHCQSGQHAHSQSEAVTRSTHSRTLSLIIIFGTLIERGAAPDVRRAVHSATLAQVLPESSPSIFSAFVCSGRSGATIGFSRSCPARALRSALRLSSAVCAWAWHPHCQSIMRLTCMSRQTGTICSVHVSQTFGLR